MKTCHVFGSLLFIEMFLEFIFKKKIQDMNGIYCLKKPLLAVYLFITVGIFPLSISEFVRLSSSLKNSCHFFVEQLYIYF